MLLRILTLKNIKMKALINGKQTEIRNGLQYEKGVPVASHVNALSTAPYQGRENFRLISSGNVYVLNYNAETYTEKRPTTFSEYLEMKKNGEKLWQ